MNANAMFVDRMSATATYFGPGSIQVTDYQPEILDLVRRRFQFGQRIKQTKATGHPSRYIEQFSIPSAGFTDPRVINPTPSQPSRGERALNLKAIVASINFGLFDQEVTLQQGEFAGLQAKDLTDMVNGVMYRHDYGLWNGNDTDLLQNTTTQYFGCSGQLLAGAAGVGGVGIGTIAPVTGTIVSGANSIVDQLKTYVSTMCARQDFDVKPTAIYANPMTCDVLDREAKLLNIYTDKVEIVPGLIVTGIMTQAGLIPLIPDSAINVYNLGGAPAVFQHTFFVVTEDLIEYHYLTDPNPRVFQLGLTGNLGGSFTAVKFGAPVVKGASYAHGCLVMVR
jgi:hypothetical protein